MAVRVNTVNKIMAEDKTQKFCATCNQPRLFTRPATNHLIHALVSLFLLGLWIPVWILVTLGNNMGRWRCSQCGGTKTK